ncbi:MAG: M48 family metallopeptidase [Candidatus Thioglobus sp.]|nr:M48 family metallopeptidase [Candidatus Thioglobus sp.]
MEYKLIRSKRKTLSLQIDKNAQLLVRAPLRLSVKKIEEFISEKQNWIGKKQEFTKQKITPKSNYQAGDLFLFLGENYPLKLVKIGNPLTLYDNFFQLNTQYEPAQAFHWFYKKEFAKIALPRLEYYSQKYDLKFNKVRFKAQKTRWGSCSAKNNINLNYLLMMSPMSIIDTIIAHELAHIRHKNHGKNFYKLLQEMLPNYKKADYSLGQNQLRAVFIS